MRNLALLFAILACGCGAGAILKDPVQDRCSSAGLRGCEDLADGIVLYVDGQKQLGYDKVKQGVGVNMDNPTQVKAFTTGMKLLEMAPAVGGYIKQIRPIIDMMDAADDDAIKNGRSGSRGADDASTAAKATAKTGGTAVIAAGPETGGSLAPSDQKLRAGTMLVAASSKAEKCNALSSSLPAAVSDDLCATAIAGPLVITDLRSPGECANEMMMLAGDPKKPRWFLFVPAGAALAVDGAQLVVGADDEVTVVARKGSASAIRQDVACSVTWAGRR